MESNRDGAKLPSTPKFVRAIAHVEKQILENLCWLIILDRLKNLWLQLLPGFQLTRAGSWRDEFWRGGFWRGGLWLVLEDVVNLLKRLFALRIAQDISSLKEYGGILLEFNRNGGELPSTLKFCHVVAHFSKQGLENFWLLIFLDCHKNLRLQFLPAWRLTSWSSARVESTHVLLRIHILCCVL